MLASCRLLDLAADGVAVIALVTLEDAGRWHLLQQERSGRAISDLASGEQEAGPSCARHDIRARAPSFSRLSASAVYMQMRRNCAGAHAVDRYHINSITSDVTRLLSAHPEGTACLGAGAVLAQLEFGWRSNHDPAATLHDEPQGIITRRP